MLSLASDKKSFAKTNSCSYIIPGIPTAFSRPKSVRNNGWDSQKSHRLSISQKLEEQHNNRALFNGPLHLDVIFYMPICPTRKKHQKPGMMHMYKPDIINLMKFIQDICVGILYLDDSFIASINCQKIYDPKPRTEIVIIEMRSNEEKKDNEVSPFTE